MGKFRIYSHAGSENHGCEALLRTVLSLVPDVETVYSEDPAADAKYGLNTGIDFRAARNTASEGAVKDAVYALRYKLTKDDRLYFKRLYRDLINEIEPGKIYLSIGGDNYCYHFNEWLQVLNSEINRRGAKSVLLGCSVNADAFEDPALADDLRRYTLITARETKTAALLREKLPEKTIHCIPDTAFLLPTVEAPLPAGFEPENTVGLNVSSVALSSAADGEVLLSALQTLITHILNETTYTVALIPHVVMPGNDDRTVLDRLYEACPDKRRLIRMDDADCRTLKGYISRCRLFIGARTHSTIAAYSSLVPTLVLGYSVKSAGIAEDLFGSGEHYVLPVQGICDERALIEAFDRLNADQTAIRDRLASVMPGYIARIPAITKLLEEL